MDSGLPAPDSKIQKLSEDADVCKSEDRISKLHDAVLCHILSFLPTKDSVRTSALAKRWNGLWVYLPNLDFELTTSYPGGLPPRLFSCKTLEVLKITGEFVFNLPFNVWLPNAKTVHLNSVVYLSDESIQKFLLGCPALEDLLIERPNWDNLWRLEISVPSLKRLTLKVLIHPEGLPEDDDEYDDDSDDEYDDDFDDDCEDEYKVIVNAPQLEYLDFEDCLSDDIMVTDMPLVVEAHLSVHKAVQEGEERDWRRDEEYGSRVYDLLGSISNVRHLHLSGDTLHSPRDFHGKLPIFQELVFLELGYDPREGPIMLPRLLKSSPKLETLVVPHGFTVPEGRKYDIENDQFYEYSWNPPEQVPECLLFSLKIVKIHHFCGHVEEELKLVKYLLSNAMVLEKMTILCHYIPYLNNPYNFEEELENYPRGSTNCQLEIYIPRLLNVEDASSSA